MLDNWIMTTRLHFSQLNFQILSDVGGFFTTPFVYTLNFTFSNNANVDIESCNKMFDKLFYNSHWIMAEFWNFEMNIPVISLFIFLRINVFAVKPLCIHSERKHSSNRLCDLEGMISLFKPNHKTHIAMLFLLKEWAHLKQGGGGGGGIQMHTVYKMARGQMRYSLSITLLQQLHIRNWVQIFFDNSNSDRNKYLLKTSPYNSKNYWNLQRLDSSSVWSLLYDLQHASWQNLVYSSFKSGNQPSKSILNDQDSCA